MYVRMNVENIIIDIFYSISVNFQNSSWAHEMYTRNRNILQKN